MAKQKYEITAFTKGIIGSPSETDIPEDAASYSVNIDPNAEDGVLRAIKEDTVLNNDGFKAAAYAKNTLTITRSAAAADNNSSTYNYNQSWFEIEYSDGTKDYAWKNGFEKCLVSLSGGIDSALVTYIATMAVGKENVKVVTLPSKFSSNHSVTDSEQLCKNLGIELINIPIKESHETFLNSLKNMFDGTKENNAEENLQARIRGNLIMAISNKFSWLVLSTGNKSEMATGYATLYGDMAGGFSVLKDVPKTLVYELSKFINKNSESEMIPKNIINKAPSAELKPDQFDQDSLPDYSILDKIIEKYIEQKESIQEILNSSEITSLMSEEKIIEILGMIDRNEYKRRQSPPGIKITSLAFGRDRRYPISSDYKFSYKNYSSS